MSKGLKELVEAALGEFAPAAPPPVDVSGEAVRVLSHLMRRWSGWGDAVLRFGDPSPVSPFARCDHNKHEFLVNIDRLLLNPNRVLLTVTPFRLKQEAVLTGCMLHETGHARHSHWQPRTSEAIASFVHSHQSIHSGEPVTEQTLKFARLLEEPRIEGFIARDADDIGATGLAWTMRAATAALLPFTNLSNDPDQQIMDIIESYVLRAGKQIGVAQWTDHELPRWVGDFNQFVHRAIVDHQMDENGHDVSKANTLAARIMSAITMMILCPDDYGTYMVDTARDILDMLYPNGSNAQPSGGCQGEGAEPAGSGPSAGEGRADEGSEGQGDSDPSDPGEGTEPGAGVSGNGDETDDGESEGASPSTAESEALAKALADIEGTAKAKATEEAQETSDKIDAQGGLKGGKGPGTTDERGYRVPTKDERDVKRGAEQFLRGLIEPTEANKVLLSDQPSANIDASLYAAWRADGGRREPQFFRRTKRTTVPSPPVDVAILVDISSSMNQLQAPSALLSWALASACLDLRNFAGRGTQIRCTLVHWGDRSRVILKPGEQVPGLKEYDCNQGTSAMHLALADVEQQMPGFFDLKAEPSNRLLVHFTDWELWQVNEELVRYTSRALEAGVNILSVVPAGYSTRRTKLPDLLHQCRIQRGKTQLMKYEKGRPEQVWQVAAQLLDINNPGSF